MLYYAFYCLCYHHMINRVIASNSDSLGSIGASAYTQMSSRIDRILSNITDSSMHDSFTLVTPSISFSAYVLRLHLDSYQNDRHTNTMRKSIPKETADFDSEPVTLLPLTLQRNLENTEREDNFSTHFFMCKAVFNDQTLSRHAKFHSQEFYTRIASYTFAPVFVAQHLAAHLQRILVVRALSPCEQHSLRVFCRLAMDVIFSLVQSGLLRCRFTAFPTVVHLEGVNAILQCFNLAFERGVDSVMAFLVRHRKHFRNCVQYFVKGGLEMFSTPVMVQYYKNQTGEGTMKDACKKLGEFFDLLKVCCANLDIEFIGFFVCCVFFHFPMSDEGGIPFDPLIQYVILRKVGSIGGRCNCLGPGEE